MIYKAITTVAGDRKIMLALANRGKVELTHMAVGDGNGEEYEPTKEMTGLKREKWRGALNKLIAHPDDPRILIATAIIPTQDGGFDVRETALYDSSGEAIVIGNYPQCYKPTPASGCSKDMTIEMWVIVADTAVINLTTDLSVVAATIADIRQLDAKYAVEVGTTTLTNSKAYPFNNSDATVSLNTPRDNLNYTVTTEVTATSGCVGEVEVYDKQLNGFKLRFTGSGTQATVKYYVQGGLIR